jgi:hypothetical protein
MRRKSGCTADRWIAPERDRRQVAGRLAQKDRVGTLGPGQGWTAAKNVRRGPDGARGLTVEGGWGLIFVALSPGTSRAWAGLPQGLPRPDGPERRRGLPRSYSPGKVKKIVSHKSKGYNALNLPALKLMALSALFSTSPGGFNAAWCTLGFFLKYTRTVVAAETVFSGFTPGNRGPNYPLGGRLCASSGSWLRRKISSKPMLLNIRKGNGL